MFRRISLSIITLFLAISYGNSQQVLPQGYFIEDSIVIGIKTPYILTLRYPRHLDVVFPDSLYDFSPYELDEKLFFPTVSDDSLSYDSAVYYVTSFEIDSTQYFQLPIFVLNSYDSTEVLAARDSIMLQHMVSEIPDSVAAEALPLIENTTYKRVNMEFNYPYFLIGMGIFIVLTVIGFIYFGEPVRKAFRLKRLRKEYLKFLERFDKAQDSNEPAEEKAQSVLVIWKGYLEKLDKKPYLKLTTKEILGIYKQDEIAEPLRAIDKIIYAQKVDDTMKSSISGLKLFAEKRYNTKLEEVKNG